MAVAFAFAVTLGFTAGGTRAAGDNAPSTAATRQLERLVVIEVNSVRRTHKLPPLRTSVPLGAAAESHSRAMGRFGFFAHESRDGSSYLIRIRRFYGPRAAGTWAVGENLLWATNGGLSATQAVAVWMNSAGHRQNILAGHWREIGVSAVSVSGAPGVFAGRDVLLVTMTFGVR